MAVYKVLDFGDIIDAVREELKISSDDTVTLNRIRRDINMVYLQEVIPYARWKWLEGFDTVKVPAVYSGGTVSVTQGSTTVTLSANPSGSLGSFLNYRFSVRGDSEIYTVSAHTSGATSITIDKPYNGTTSSTASYDIWRDWVGLPVDADETVSVWHDFSGEPMEGRGLQDFRKIQMRDPKRASRPYFYYTGDFFDPSTGTDELVSDRYRQLWFWPAQYDKDTNINVNYKKRVDALEDDADEPVLPFEDRIVLVFGALHRAWSRERNPEEAMRNRGLFEQKLARMAGKTEDTQDKPQFTPESTYMGSKRGGRSGFRSSLFSFSSGGGGGATVITYLADVTINGATITGNVTVNSGITIDGRDISVDGAALDAHIAASTSVHGTSGAVVGTTDTQTLSGKTYRLGASFQNKVLVGTNDSNGDITYNSAIDASELSYLAGVEAIQDVTLTDNTTDQVVDSWAAASYDIIHIDYSISRGSGNIAAGRLTIVTDGTNAALADGGAAELGTLGVSFSADVSGGNVRLLSTTTSTGTAADMRYKLQKWLS